jgi:hypothetical protein
MHLRCAVAAGFGGSVGEDNVCTTAATFVDVLGGAATTLFLGAANLSCAG